MISMLNILFDPYDRKARLYPAFLAFLPLIGVVAGVYGFALEVKSGAIGLLASFGVFYLLASIVRELGKRLEDSLFEEWGGKPTNQLLRHRNEKIDPITKARYHSFLAEQTGTIVPSKLEEINNPLSADHFYQSGTKWLLSQTRVVMTTEK